jgi:hypothetical protein
VDRTYTKETNMNKIVLVMLALAAFAGNAFAEGIIELPAARHNVMFTHKHHQKLLKDCTICHVNSPGVVEDMGKDWAHKTCLGCHVFREKGPISCPDCHNQK